MICNRKGYDHIAISYFNHVNIDTLDEATNG